MKQPVLFCVVIAALLVSGCDTTRPSEPIASVAPGNAEAASASTQPSPQPDPAANGGSSLPASAPYDGGATVTQNVNAAPFLAGSQTSSGSTSAPLLQPSSLTSRADGTMSGSNDQPAASTGWGTPATNWSSPAPAPASKPPAKKKK